MQFFLSVCESVPVVTLGDSEYKAGFQGEVQVSYEIKDDVIFIDLKQCGHSPWISEASDINAISIRICDDSVSVIAVYEDLMKNVVGSCYCCDNGCCVYASGGGGCEAEPK